ncbi:MAG: T9SS type A sorting domain-containing protein, partial [Bacteroidales bacterium]|nr:T9SS type A sorting domain-containing protein [Bacteroidales bacterium]
LTLRISNNPTTFSFLFHTKIREIKIDPKMWLLAKYETTITSDTTPLSTIEAFPNPFRDCIKIVFPLSKQENYPKKIWIYNVYGQQVFNTELKSSISQICLPQLSSGKYLLVAEDYQRRYICWIIKY